MKFDIDQKIKNWKGYLNSHGSFLPEDLEELETHLRDEIEVLQDSGLDVEEAYFIGIKRLGKSDVLSREFYKINAQSLWKHLFTPSETGSDKVVFRDVWMIVGLAFLAGFLGKIPDLFGYRTSVEADSLIYLRNLSLFFIPVIGGWFVIQKKNLGVGLYIFVVLCIGGFLAVNFFPFTGTRQTEILAGIHLLLLLWIAMERLYSSGQEIASGRMNYITFSGEFFIYSVLCYLGGGVFTLFTVALFDTLNIESQKFISEYIVVFGGLAVPVVAVYLVEKKKALIENMAPVLAKIFTPLFLLLITGFLVALLGRRLNLTIERETLIIFDLLLVLVLGLVLYSLSARNHSEKPVFSDYLVFILILVTLLADIVAMCAIISRLSQFGLSPNRVAALGENILLFINLLGLAFTFGGTIFFGRSFRRLEVWQSYCYVGFMVWMAVVVFIFPLVFRFA
ncbi:hypothetical protein JW824_07560 [bacterium]|nr:hypothetical protein [bacterium]RQV95080.1 MAG: hypothetical protein EH221_06950 [bacterium]